MAKVYGKKTVVKGAYLHAARGLSRSAQPVFSNTSPPLAFHDLLPPEAVARTPAGAIEPTGPLGTFIIDVTFVPQGAVARGETDTVSLQPLGAITPLMPVPRQEQPLDPVQRAAHYNQHPSGLECRDVVRDLPFALGNLVKYLWRWEQKGSPVQDLQKALWYLREEIERAQWLAARNDEQGRPRPYSYVRDEILRGDVYVLGAVTLDLYVARLISLTAQPAADDVPPDPLAVWARTFAHCLVAAATNDPNVDMGGDHMFTAVERAIVAQLRARGLKS